MSRNCGLSSKFICVFPDCSVQIVGQPDIESSRTVEKSNRICAMFGFRHSDRLEAAKSLEAVLGEAEKAGFLGQELEAGLALGEIELQSGDVVRARRRLEALERRAAAQGFGLIVRKAAAARK